MGKNFKNSSKRPIDNPFRYSLTTCFKDKHITEFLWPQKGGRVLDLGCGIGYVLSLFNSSDGRLCGMDLSWESLMTARKYVRGNMIRGDAQELPFRDDVFDRIIFADVIEHLPNDNASLKEVMRVSRRNAKIVISTPALEGLITRTWLKRWLHRVDDRYQRDYCPGYTAESLRNLAKAHHIRVDRIRYTNYYLTEILVGILKLAFFIKKRHYDSQNEIEHIAKDRIFRIYRRFIFPIFYWIGRVEESICRNIIKGHCLILCGTVDK